MAKEKASENKNRINPNKSQVKGVRAKVPRNLNLSTSLCFSRTTRKLFGECPSMKKPAAVRHEDDE